ncbi:MAG: mannose-1-phosphate guanylyltransferase, partial [Solirubrobacteraceae bacterium]
MAGGIGTRLWPLSTSKKPKQFHDLLGVGKSILQLTFERVALVIPKENIYIITNYEFEEITKKQLKQVNAEQIIIEPHAKNTAICNIYGALKIYKKNKNATILVTPSDQIIVNESLFINDLKNAFQKASKNNLITFGIKPINPNTGYGYIQFEIEKKSDELNKVKLFTEKPDLEIAKSFIESGDFMWNSGIFVWKAESILNSFKSFLPEMYYSFIEIEDSINTSSEYKAIKKVYT